MQKKINASVTQLYLLMFIAGASLIGIGLYGISNYKKLNDAARTLYADRVVCIRLLANIRFQYIEEIVPAAISVKSHLLTFEEARQRVRKARLTIDSNWHDYKSTYLTREESLLAKQTDALKDRVDEEAQALESILQKKNAAALDTLIKGQLPAAQTPFSMKLTQLMNLQERVGKQIFESSSHTYDTASKNLDLWILFSVLIAVSASFFIIKKIKRLVKNILTSHDNIALSEHKYRSILENASDAIYIADNTGNFIDLSKSMCKMLGYSKEELMRLNFSDIVDPENLKAIPIERPAVPNEPIFKERTFITSDGEKVEIEISGQRLDADRLMGVARNVTERKRIEAELREAESKFRSLVEKSIVGVYLAHLDTRLLYVNQRFAELFGYEPQELIDMGDKVVDNIYNKKNQDIVMAELQKRETTKRGINHFEVEGIKKDGSSFWLEVYSNVVTIKGQRTSIGSIVDITERKRIETELREAELKFRTVAEKSMLGVYITQNKRFLYVNPRFAEIFGYTRQELIDLSSGIIDTIYAEESRAMIREKIRARDAGETEGAHYEAIGLKKDGTTTHVEFYGNRVMINGQPATIGTMLDITERKQAQELILKEKELSSTIINSLPGIFYLRDENGRGLRWNKNLEVVTGYTTEEIAGTVLRNLIAEEDREKMPGIVERTLKEGHSTAEIQLATKDGRKIPYLLSKKTVIYENQLCLLGIGTDISQRVKTEEELKISERNLAEYNRELTLLNRINDIILRNEDELELYTEVCNCIVEVGDYKLAWICHGPDKNDADQIVKPLAAAGALDYLSGVKIDLSNPEHVTGPTGTSLRARKTFVNNDVNNIVFFEPWIERAKKYGIQSSLSLYLDLGDGKTGALMIYNGQTDAFDAHQLSILERLAANLSIAVQNIENRSILIESENRFRSAFEDSAIGMGLVSPAGKWLKVNRSIYEMLGYTERELLSLTFQQITHPEDLEKDVQLLYQTLRGEIDTYRMEKRYFHKDGNIVWVNLNVSLVRGADKLPLYFVSQIENITERVESQLKYQNLVENFIVGVYILKNGKLVYVNHRFLEETGYSEEEIINMPFEKFVYKDDLELVQKIIDSRTKGLIDTARYEVRIVKKDGQPLWFEILGSKTVYQGAAALMGTMINISKRKAAHDELTKSEANLKSIFEATDVSYLLLDTKYNIMALNQQMRDVYLDIVGIRLKEGDDMIKLIRQERRETIRELYEGVLLTKTSSGYESSFTNNGFTRHLASSVFPIIVGNEAIGICISTIDITERRNALENLKAANKDLQKKTKELEFSNSELEQFAYVASHDLQEPLRMVTSFLSQLEKKYTGALDDKAKQYIYFATDGAKRMRQLILDLLEYSRAGRTESDLEQVNLNELVQDILMLFRRNIEETKANVRFGDLPTLNIYKTPVRQVFQNLIGNALKYCKPGVAPVVEIYCTEKKTAWEFVVSDNGIGIDPEFFDQIFIIFKRLHNREEYTGTGMGLAITKKIIEHLGGSIWVNSKEGEGSAFHFTIPKYIKA